MSFSQGSFLSLSQAGFHRIAYVDWGNPASDHVVVCAHGLARNSRDFDYMARDLAGNCRVICVDIVGRGWEEPVGTDAELNRRVEVQWFMLE